jgi:hypothetical protein
MREMWPVWFSIRTLFFSCRGLTRSVGYQNQCCASITSSWRINMTDEKSWQKQFLLCVASGENIACLAAAHLATLTALWPHYHSRRNTLTTHPCSLLFVPQTSVLSATSSLSFTDLASPDCVIGFHHSLPQPRHCCLHYTSLHLSSISCTRHTLISSTSSSLPPWPRCHVRTASTPPVVVRPDLAFHDRVVMPTVHAGP